MTRAGPEFSTAQDRIHVDYRKLLEALKKDNADFVGIARTIEASLVEQQLIAEEVFETTRKSLRAVQEMQASMKERHDAAKERIGDLREQRRIWRSAVAEIQRKGRRMAWTERKLRRFARGGFLQTRFIEGFCTALIAKGVFLLWLIVLAANDPY